MDAPICLCIHPSGADHSNFILYYRESSPHFENRVVMEGSTFLILSFSPLSRGQNY